MTPSSRSQIDQNRQHWTEVTRFHEASAYYPVDQVIAGASTLAEEEVREIGDVNQLVGVHLQCGIGLETISLSRLGARMTGIDFASSAIIRAKQIAEKSGVECSFHLSDVEQVAKNQTAKFDFVYTSHGAIRWLTNLKRWATSVRKRLKSGGFIYVFDVHPMVFRARLNPDSSIGVSGSYFASPQPKTLRRTHIGPLPEGVPGSVIHTDWALSDVATALLNANFRIVLMSEHAGCCYNAKGLFPRRIGTLWYPEKGQFPIPGSFSMKAIKE